MSGEPDKRPFAFVEKIGGTLSLAHCSARALELGITSGMTLADARARVPELDVAEQDCVADDRFLTRIAEIFDRFTPMLTIDRPHGVMLDITGCAHLFGGEKNLVSQIMTWAANAGLFAKIALAAAPDAARGMARFGSGGICPPEASEARARLLPVAALECEHETLTALKRAGLKCLGDLADIPAQNLAARFGQDLVSRLRRILGFEDIRISPLRSLPVCSAELHFAEPLRDLQRLEMALEDLIVRVIAMLEEREDGGRVFQASFFRSDGEVRRIAVETGRPSRSRSAILSLFRETMEALTDPIDPGFGFDIVRLSVSLCEPLRQLQSELDGHEMEGEAVSELIDRLSVRFGPHRVMRFREADTHDPSRCVVLIPAASVKGPGDLWRPLPSTAEPPLRPLYFFEPPQPITATLIDVPDGPPKQFQWRRVLHTIARAEGPERIAPEWWRKDLPEEIQDYYRVEDIDGRRFWIFRTGTYAPPVTEPRWFVRGLFA